MMCLKILRNLEAFLHGEVVDEVAQLIDIHLGQCQRCRNEANRLRKIDRILDQNSCPEPESGFLGRFQRRRDGRRPGHLVVVPSRMETDGGEEDSSESLKKIYGVPADVERMRQRRLKGWLVRWIGVASACMLIFWFLEQTATEKSPDFSQQPVALGGLIAPEEGAYLEEGRFLVLSSEEAAILRILRPRDGVPTDPQQVVAIASLSLVQSLMGRCSSEHYANIREDVAFLLKLTGREKKTHSVPKFSRRIDWSWSTAHAQQPGAAEGALPSESLRAAAASFLRGQYPEALTELPRLVEGRSSRATRSSAALLRARTLAALGRYGEARRASREFLEAFPERRDIASWLMARIAVIEGEDLKIGIQEVQVTHSVDPLDWLRLVQHQLAAGRYAEASDVLARARVHCRSALEQDPKGFAWMLYLQGWALARSGRSATSLSVLDQAVRTGAGMGSLLARIERACRLATLDQPGWQEHLKALGEIDTSQGNWAQELPSLLQLALALHLEHRGGSPEELEIHWQGIFSRDPQGPVADHVRRVVMKRHSEEGR